MNRTALLDTLSTYAHCTGWYVELQARKALKQLRPVITSDERQLLRGALGRSAIVEEICANIKRRWEN